ncbi:MAG TPA: acyl-ACP--UDP-N-acetylglucosamine O-acyltransferase [Fimbriimonas sp.]|nr:acyl-ACP--UDP-N-acetylglucosamine O-acyltransferase [Fimbriimonas sp.]
MPKIHPFSVVDPLAELADDVEVGPFCNVEAHVVIGAGTKLDSHATVKEFTTIGERNYVGQGAVLGGLPQDRKFQGEPSYLRIGNDNIFREYVTVHRGSGAESETRIGNDNFVMAYTHFGHNIHLHDHITVANGVNLAGHVTVEDNAVLGGMTGVHQFVHIGKVAMVGGMARVNVDIPPFMVTGKDAEVLDINAVGLRRYGITSESRLALHKACKLLFKSRLGLSNAMEIVRREVPLTEEVKYLLEFEERRSQGKNGRGDQP